MSNFPKVKRLRFLRKRTGRIIYVFIFFVILLATASTFVFLPSFFPLVLGVGVILGFILILPCPVCDCPDELNTPYLEVWLAQHRTIQDALVWEYPTGSKTYTYWEVEDRHLLREAFQAAYWWFQLILDDPPPNEMVLADDDNATTVLSETNAKRLFLAHVAQCLAYEIRGLLPWSITEYSDEHLALLFDSRWMFHWDANNNGYKIILGIHGTVVPASPLFTLNFLYENGIVPTKGRTGWSWTTRVETIARLLEWCRKYLIHFSGREKAQNLEDQFQYRGYPPVKRIIEGTTWAGMFRHRTAGCWGTAGFLRAVLRTLNIPVTVVGVVEFDGDLLICAHGQPFFIADGRYLAHGDDPYGLLTRGDPPPFPAEEFLIDQATYDAWFGPGISGVEKCKNVHRRSLELAVQYLPINLLYLHCSDLTAGNTHENSDVFDNLKTCFTLDELEAMNLWVNMDAKIAILGGCDQIHPWSYPSD